MPEITVYVSPRFSKHLRKLPPQIKNLAIRKDKIFRINPWTKQLRTHKLKGVLDSFWAYSINRDYRVFFRFLSDTEVLYYDIGTHSIYK